MIRTNDTVITSYSQSAQSMTGTIKNKPFSYQVRGKDWHLSIGDNLLMTGSRFQQNCANQDMLDFVIQLIGFYFQGKPYPTWIQYIEKKETV